MLNRQQKPRLVITENFLKDLETVIMYGYTVFGEHTAKKLATNPKKLSKIK